MTNLQYCTEILGIIGDVSVAEDAIYQLGFDVYRKLGGQEDKPTIDTIYKELKQAISIWDNTDNLTITENGSYSLLGKTIDVSVACGPTPVIIQNDEIWYTGTEALSDDSFNVLDASGNRLTLLSNTFSDGNGILKFSGDIIKIGSGAFWYKNTLTGIEIPNSVLSIGENAFMSSRNLQNVVLGEGVTSIEEGAFYETCIGPLFNVPDTVTSIEEAIFMRCNNLEYAYLGKGITSIPDNTDNKLVIFKGCQNLSSVEINMPTIVGQTFTSSNNMNNILTTERLHPMQVEYIIGNDVTRIGEYAFYGTPSHVKSITIGTGVTNIRQSAFRDSQIKSLNIPNNVTTLGANLCYGCTSLQSVTISNGISVIPGYCFSGCTNLSNITYNGTMDQWTALNKLVGWRTDVPATVVHCTDGDISIYTP